MQNGCPGIRFPYDHPFISGQFPFTLIETIGYIVVVPISNTLMSIHNLLQLEFAINSFWLNCKNPPEG